MTTPPRAVRDGHYVFQGGQAVIVGAHGYRLCEGASTSLTDGELAGSSIDRWGGREKTLDQD